MYLPTTEHDACGIGFVANIDGEKSRAIVDQGLEVLLNLRHRAAVGADPLTGDGAGMLLQLPHRFFKAEGLRLGFNMPMRRRYGVAQIFLPQDDSARLACEQILLEVVADEGQRVLGWRDVPVNVEHVGEVARQVMPRIRQLYIERRRVVPSAFERKLYVIRKRAERRVASRRISEHFHIASLSSETIVYKGLLLPQQLAAFYADLTRPEMVSAIALVHSRFSTNTFPTWDLAQPFRFIAHNGEINTVQGNRNWMLARRSQLTSAKFDGGLEHLYPIIVPGRSDTAQFDNMLELLHFAGRSLPHAMMMMIPEAWTANPDISEERRNYYRYAGALSEPWDGPAAIAFTDGHIVGATLDRNGLRPARYVVTDDRRVILASEAGVIDVPAERVLKKGRLRPGKMLLVDTEERQIIDDEDVKAEIAHRFPYGRWLRRNVFDADDARLPRVEPTRAIEGDALHRLQRAFGYTDETLRLVITPMAEQGKEPLGSMGCDTPLAVLSQRAPNLFYYFHQRFAQVTNPAIDPIREALVMSLATSVGPAGNTFEESPEQCHQVHLNGPLLTSEGLARIAAIREGAFEATRLSLLYPVDADDQHALSQALKALCAAASDAIDSGYNILILSDRGVDNKQGAIPSLLAVSAVHQHLVRHGSRMQAGLIVETAEAREVHDFAALVGYGAAAINPYLALDSIADLVAEGKIALDSEKAQQNYFAAVDAGLLKVMSRLGISTIDSYRNAQMFEAVGLNRQLIDRHFTGTPSRLGGIGLTELAAQNRARHQRGFRSAAALRHPIGGEYQWRQTGEWHKWEPAAIAELQAAVRQNCSQAFARYSQIIDREQSGPATLRGLLDFVPGVAVALSEVEPVGELVKRFVSGAMSFGSISVEAHETLAIAMNRIGGRSNSGEGGEERERYRVDENGDLRRSAIKQVASGRFGVTAEYLVNADDLQIKIAQGAKPGEGGQLPGEKVDQRIAKVRCSTPGVTLISPPPHHDIYSIEDLAQLIYDLQVINPDARVSVKLVSQVGVGTVAAGVVKAHAGAIVVAGYEGGTGASPLSSIKRVGLPWEIGLAETQQVLVQNNLRGRVRLQVDGGLRTARDVAIAALLGAEEFGFATSALISMGCILLRKCHLNSCSVGIATQDPKLRERFAGRVEHVVNFFTLLAEALRALMAELGFRSIDEMVGRVDRLRQRVISDVPTSQLPLDLSAVIALPAAPPEWPRRYQAATPWELERHFDKAHMLRLRGALDRGQRQRIEGTVKNTDRAVGTYLSGVVARRHGAAGLPADTVTIAVKGSAGQSFGAFLARGLTLELEGEANDYLGKGLSGGKIAVFPAEGSRFRPEENIIVGNTVLYGATSGELYVCGVAGERFAVRNSGALAVVEGVGDHGCEYMTGGVVLVIGETGRNFAAGMSGGVAYVFDPRGVFAGRCNPQQVDLEAVVEEADIEQIYQLLENHVAATRSQLGGQLIDNFSMILPSFVKVMAREYKRVLQAQRATAIASRADDAARPNGAADG
ncbi:MAG: glutamate synthase large subunit [Deltaproteobacteria bacterium]|nr:glutamate synthase large subunit [Deltaproteobacteria bacterium]